MISWFRKKKKIDKKEDKQQVLLKQLPAYKNALYEENYTKIMAEPGFDDQTDNFKYVKRISFQLSNLCNYANIHKRCPLNLEKDKIILPSNIIYNVLDELSKFNYKGVIGFHVYNEPMIDPRLFMFIKRAKETCPNSKILILTNGYYLNEVMFRELKEIGVNILHVSAYTKKEYDRLVSLDNNSFLYYVLPALLDDRMNQYDRKQLNCKKSCSAPLNEVCIAPNGEIFLCCLDWRLKHTFGNLKDNNLKTLLNSEEVNTVFNELQSGNRYLHLCERCDWVR